MTIQFEKLLTLAEFLETVPEDRLIMRHWVDQPETAECGFAGCAIGWAVHAKLFPELTLVHADPYPRSWYPQCEGYISFSAVTKLFGIDRMSAERLFAPYYYVDGAATPTEVATRIREFVADKKSKFQLQLQQEHIQ